MSNLEVIERQRKLASLFTSYKRIALRKGRLWISILILERTI